MSILNPNNEKNKLELDAIRKYRQEINTIYKKIDVNDLIFKGSAKVEVEIIGNSLSVVLESCSLKDKMDCFDTDKTGAVDITIQVKLLSKMIKEIVTSKGRTPVSAEGDEAVETITEMDSAVVSRMIVKMEQFMTAVQMLVDGSGELSLDDIIKK